MLPSRCRACHGALDTIIHLGDLQVSTFPLPGEAPSARAPLDLCQCDSCGLVQLRHTVDPDELFRHYWYRSGVNETMIAELQSVVDRALALTGGIPAGQVVVDVGANDGTLLSLYARWQGRPLRIGIEPALNLVDELQAHADVVLNGYFPEEGRHLQDHVVKILTSIACFYDLDDPGCFVAEVARVLHESGVWVVQFQDLHQMIEASAFDNICHEHLVYYSLGSFERLIQRYGLRVVEAERRVINGGSLRLFVMHAGARPQGHSVADLRAAERGCEDWQTLNHFAFHADMMRRQIQAIVEACRRQGQTIDLYGASTKGNTLLQYCGLGPGEIRQAWERSEPKWGRQTVTGIPIVSEDAGRANPPDLLLCGIWQFREAVLRREAAYLQAGGTMLFPLPRVDVVTGNSATKGWKGVYGVTGGDV